MKKTLSLILLLIAMCLQLSAQEKDMSAYLPKLQIGETAPNFTLPKYDNSGSVSLSDYKGKYVLLDFWASWCGDCRREMPIMEEAFADNKEKIEVLSVSFDRKKEALQEYLKAHPVNYTVACDYSAWKESAVTKAYQLAWIPTFYIIAPDGKIAGGGITGEELKAELQRIMLSIDE
ncbi:MAG: TlpA family protein disulfide reductase [Prevotella sp.]|nr:TlpA family protein disulfide reductase [Prevotella sp.]